MVDREEMEKGMPTIVHKGTKLAFEDRGAGKPTFVFVHGWACDRSFFAPQAEHFARRHRVVSVDLRGHGESDKPPGQYPIGAYADDIAYIIEQLGFGKTVAVGHSMGGVTVLQLAAAHPDCVAAIVMVDPASLVSPPERRVALEAVAAGIEAGDHESCRQFIKGRNDGDVVRAEPCGCRCHKGALEFDGRAVAAQCKVPALHLAATPPRNPPHLMSEWLPNVVNGWTVGAGHFNQLEVPDQVNAMIEAFLRHYV
jgi:pimeloyl-ACP methyl ester carboxylesterase